MILNKLINLPEVNKNISTDLRDKVIEYLLFECLFPLKDSLMAYKCTSHKTRELAFDLVIGLMEDKGSYDVLKNCIALLRPKITAGLAWGYSPEKHKKSKLNFVGIKNLGSICYMNSMLQQFFAVKAFSSAIMSINEKKYKIDDKGTLYQLQRIFVFLMNSSRKAIDPIDFCLAFKDSDGKPINVHVQKDAHEFLNIFFEKLEYELKNTLHNLLLRSIFKGQSCSQVICINCGNISNTFEDYYTLSLEIKNHKNMQESLEKYITSTTVSDYLCNECSGKCNVKKRTVLFTLPNVLIVHLQRFTYNFDMLTNEKIHTRFEFPTTLDMFSYTKEGVEQTENAKLNESKKLEIENPLSSKETNSITRPKDYYLYNLTGIVIHSGNANFGHYYSYIKVNEDDWVEFNDTHIAKFSLAKLEAECFGGLQDSSESLSSATNSKSAYMLIYERQMKLPMPIRVERLIKESPLMLNSLDFYGEEHKVLEAMQKSVKVVYRNISLNEYYQFRNFGANEIILPNRLNSEVMNDNVCHLFERLIHSKEFVKFACQLFVKACFYLEECNNQKTRNCILIEELTKMISELYQAFFITAFPCVELSNVSYFTLFEKAMVRFFSDNFAVSYDLLRSLVESPSKTMEIFVRCPELVIRQCICKTSSSAFLRIYSEEHAQFAAEKDSLNKTFIDMCINLIGSELATQWIKFGQFFEMLYDISRDTAISLYLIRTNFIAIAVDFMLGSKSPIVASALHKSCDVPQAADFSKLLELISLLSKYVIIKTGNELKQTNDNVMEYKPEDDTAKCLFSVEMIKRHLQENRNIKQISDLIVRACSQSEMYNRKICRILLQIANKDDLKKGIEIIELLGQLICSKDLYLTLRLECILGYWQPLNLSDSAEAEEVNTFIVPLIDDKRDGLLQLIWKHKSSEIPFSYHGIKAILNGMLCCSETNEYIRKMPAPSCKYKYYITWVKEFTNLFKGDESIQILLEKLKKVKNKVFASHYRIGKIVQVRPFKELTEKLVKLIITEIDTEVVLVSRLNTISNKPDNSPHKKIIIKKPQKRRLSIEFLNTKNTDEAQKSSDIVQTELKPITKILLTKDTLNLTGEECKGLKSTHTQAEDTASQIYNRIEDSKAETVPHDEKPLIVPYLLKLTVENGISNVNAR